MLEEDIVGTICVKLFKIWAGSGDVIKGRIPGPSSRRLASI